MILQNTSINLDDWVDQAPSLFKEYRISVQIILTAISLNSNLADNMIMKGGSLLAIRYNSKRHTTDVDFSTQIKLDRLDLDSFIKALNDGLDIARVDLGHSIKCVVQSYEVKPKSKTEPTFPTLEVKIGYANQSNKNEMKMLGRKQSSKTVRIDYSFNEKSYNVEKIRIDEDYINVYSIHDLIAEKYRAIIQQKTRDRSRFQDIYDLNFLITHHQKNINAHDRNLIFLSMREKFKNRNIEEYFDALMMDDNEIYNRSKKDYYTIEDTIEDPLPDFDASYKRVADFLLELPWDEIYTATE